MGERSGDEAGPRPPERLSRALAGASQVVRFQDVQEKAGAYLDAEQLRLLQRAYIFSARAHEGQSRLSGEPYLVHPIAVAEILAELHVDPVTVAAGLLHDVLEDTATTPQELERTFGKEIAQVVDGVTKLGKLAYSTKEEVQAESFRKMVLAMADDLRVILVKLADRLHNMRTLHHLPRRKQVEIARETAEIFAPIAHRLGMGRLKHELEELSFRFAEPERHAELQQELDQHLRVEKGFIRRTEGELAEVLAAGELRAEIRGRRKSLTSIDRKTRDRGIPVAEVEDYLAFRLVTESVPDCYAALGLIHARWTPIQARFKDYIATPKPNGYQSLHTVVRSDDGHPFEVQIRTAEMHLIAEEGIAAHWAYKEQGVASASEAALFAWLRNLVDAQKAHADPREFMEAVKLDLYGDEVYCFTPKGEVRVFPAGSTAIDFAYAIHTEVGHRCVGARIDGKMAPLRTRLQHGNRVELLTSQSQTPSRDWLKFAATSRARSKIRSWFHARERDQALEVGRARVERAAARSKTGLRRIFQSAAGREALKHFSFRDPDDLFLAVGRDKFALQAFMHRIRPSVPAAPAAGDAAAGDGLRHARLRRDRRRSAASRGPVVAGEQALLTSLARCCRPVRGEPVVGYVTRGRGVSVHREGCRALGRGPEDASRLLSVSWADEEDQSFDVPLRLAVRDRPGVLGNVTGALAELGVNIKTASARTLTGGRGMIALTVVVADIEDLDRVRAALARVEGVDQVNR